MEERLRVITHRGQTIALLDLSNLQDEKEVVRLLKMRTGLEKPHGLLVDVTNTHISPGSMGVAKGGAKGMRELLKATAVVGTGSMVGMMVRAVSRFSGMSILTFATRQEAMDWLATEMAKK